MSSNLTIKLRDDQIVRLSNSLPWGIGKRLWHVIIDDLLDTMDEFGPDLIIGLIINNRAKPRDTLPAIGRAIEQAKALKNKE